jgi:hypothetical protein
MERLSDWIVGIMVGVFGLVGLVMAVGARDEEIFIFGASLAVFAGVFIYGLYKGQTAAAVATVKGDTHG